MTTVSNRDIERLYDKYNPNGVKTGDRVKVTLGSTSYVARIVGLELDLKNKKLYANLKLSDSQVRLPIRVDCADCSAQSLPLYPGHHNNS